MYKYVLSGSTLCVGTEEECDEAFVTNNFEGEVICLNKN